MASARFLAATRLRLQQERQQLQHAAFPKPIIVARAHRQCVAQAAFTRRSRHRPSHRPREQSVVTAKALPAPLRFISLESFDELSWKERFQALIRHLAQQPEVRSALQAAQFAASLIFVVLYIWSTYSTPAPWSWRYNLDLFLCATFAIDWTSRLVDAESKSAMLLGIWNVLDVLAFLPPLVESFLMHGAHVTWFTFGRFDFRWFKILRTLRVMRLSLLAGELRTVHLSSSGALLSSAASVRLFQLVASVLTLLFTASSIVHLCERIPWHEALYFVTTTLTTVGYGDLTPTTMIGKVAVLAMICVGVVVIPVQTSQVYSQLTARRATLGAMPDRRTPTVLASMHLTEVRGFSDFCSEFFQALEDSGLPKKLRMIVLCNKPSFEFRAFQELNEKRVTLMEGSALSERDLQRSRAESASATFLMADRFSSDFKQEDLNVQFQVWALKSYTKSVPLYVQVLQRSSMALIAPFLDPEHDVIVSSEQTRHRLLALSCLCPGASTLIANLLRTALVSPSSSQRRTTAGRRWLRAYVNGCAHKVWRTPISPQLAGRTFAEGAEWLFRATGLVLIGLMEGRGVILNPGRRALTGVETAVVVGASQEAVMTAMSTPFSVAPEASEVLLTREAGAEEHLDEDNDFVDELGQPCTPEHGRGHLDSDEEVLCMPLDSMLPDLHHLEPSAETQMPAVRAAAAAVGAAPPSSPVPQRRLSAAGRERLRRRRRRRQAAARQGTRMLEGYSTQAAAFAWKTGTDSYDDEADEGIEGEAEGSGSSSSEDEDTHALEPPTPESEFARSLMEDAARHLEQGGRLIYEPPVDVEWHVGDLNGMPSHMQALAALPQSLQSAPEGMPVLSEQPPLLASPAARQGSSQQPAGQQHQPLQQQAGTGRAAPPERPVTQGRDGLRSHAISTGDSEEEDDTVSSSTSVADTMAQRAVPQEVKGADKISGLRDHVIVCGAEESFLNFVEQLRRCDPMQAHVVVLHHRFPRNWSVLHGRFSPIHYVQGDPSDSAALRGARASSARALVFLAHAQRPAKAADADDAFARTSRGAVLADAEALLTCYGVGEESGAELLHAVVELCFTSSIRFLQPGLLLKGNMSSDEYGSVHGRAPRRSWLMRKRQERAAMKEGLAEWQANPYFCAGRVMVPALMDTVVLQAFINRGMLTDLLTELAGDDGRPGGAMLRQIPLPPRLAGRTYGDLFAHLALHRKLLPLGLYRRKSENSAWRLQYVVTNPPASERLEPDDRVFVLRERGGSWLL